MYITGLSRDPPTAHIVPLPAAEQSSLNTYSIVTLNIEHLAASKTHANCVEHVEQFSNRLN